jgi:hypothetical protein
VETPGREDIVFRVQFQHSLDKGDTICYCIQPLRLKHEHTILRRDETISGFEVMDSGLTYYNETNRAILHLKVKAK